MKRASTNSLREPSVALALVVGEEPRLLNDLAKQLAELSLSSKREAELARLPPDSALSQRLHAIDTHSPKLIDGMKQLVLDFSKPAAALAGRIKPRSAKALKAKLRS